MKKYIFIIAILLTHSCSNKSNNTTEKLENKNISIENISTKEAPKKNIENTLKKTEIKDVSLTGFIIDGPIAGSKVFIDINGNGIQDQSEEAVISGKDGGYTLTRKLSSDFVVVAIGGTNTSTGKPFNGVLSSYLEIDKLPEVSHITPISTLISEYKKNDKEKSINDIKDNISKVLELNIEDLDKNPMDDVNVFVKSNLINQSVEIINNQLANSDKERASNYTNIISKFAQSIETIGNDLKISDISLNVIDLIDNKKLNGLKNKINSYIKEVESLKSPNIEQLVNFEMKINEALWETSLILSTDADIATGSNFISTLEKKESKSSPTKLNYFYFNGSYDESIQVSSNNIDGLTYTLTKPINGLSLSKDGAIHLASFPSDSQRHDFDVAININNGFSELTETISIRAYRISYQFSVNNENSHTVFIDYNNNDEYDSNEMVLEKENGYYIYNQDMRNQLLTVTVANGMSIYGDNIIGNLKTVIDGSDMFSSHEISFMTTLLYYLHSLSDKPLNSTITQLSNILGLSSNMIRENPKNEPILFVSMHNLIHLVDLISQLIPTNNHSEKHFLYSLIMNELSSIIYSKNGITKTTLPSLTMDLVNNLDGETFFQSSIDLSQKKDAIHDYMSSIDLIDKSSLTPEKYSIYLDILNTHLSEVAVLINNNQSLTEKLSQIAQINLPSTETQDKNNTVPIAIELESDLIFFNNESLSLTATATGGNDLQYQWNQISGRIVSLPDSDKLTTDVIFTPINITETFEFQLTVNNDKTSSSKNVRVLVKDSIYEAMKTGNPSLLPDDISILEQRIIDLIAIEKQELVVLHNELLEQGEVIFDPKRTSRILDINSTDTKKIIVGNGGNTFITAFNHNGQKTIAFGSSLIVDIDYGHHEKFEKNIINMVNWLLNRNGDEVNDNQVNIAIMLMSDHDMNKTKKWLEKVYSSIAISICKDEENLNTCLNSSDLIITGSDTTFSQARVLEALDQAHIDKRSLLYTHNKSWNSTAMTNPILQYFGVQTDSPGSPGNYFSEDKAEWSSPETMREATDTLNSISNLIAGFQTNSFNFSISDCKDDDESCSNIPAYAKDFLNPIKELKETIKQLDNRAHDIFTNQDRSHLLKLIILLADKYRSSVTFPMAKNVTNTLSFLKSLFADYLVYTHRKHNKVQTDLGNFSRSDFSHILPESKTVNIPARRYFRSAGIYALPGQTITATRKDDNPEIITTLFINSQRSSSVKTMRSSEADSAYNRPKFVQSNKLPIAPGDSLQFSSPYGGPIYIGFNDTFVDQDTVFEFSNIGQHPVWRQGHDDNDFLKGVEENAYDWVEVITEHFEIHSSLNKIKETFNDIRWDTPSELEYYITKYHHNYHKILSGHRGQNIDVIDEIHDFASQYDFSLKEFKDVQHFNADQATCGYGCSGNPYDAFWAFTVLGHGDLHEVGHNVESARFKFTQFEHHAVTNFYSYYAKSRAFLEDGIEHNCQKLPFDEILTDVQTSLQEPDPKAYMASLQYNTWDYGVAFVIQMMMHAQERGLIDNGWHLIPRLHILLKHFEIADDNDNQWNETKNKLGFSLFDRSEARNINGNDWLLIAASYAVGLDYRPFLDLLGINYTDKAINQLTHFNFPMVDKAIFVPSSKREYCTKLIGHQKYVF